MRRFTVKLDGFAVVGELVDVYGPADRTGEAIQDLPADLRFKV